LCVFSSSVGHALQAADGSPTLCPNLIASLVAVPGNLDAMYAAQRVEIRQCPVDISKQAGAFQLVAWAKGAKSPGLIYETEESGFYQFVMIEGVYVFEFMGGTAQPVLAIVFERDTPRIALNTSTLHEPVITCTPSKVIVELIDARDNTKRRFEFQRSGIPRRKG